MRTIWKRMTQNDVERVAEQFGKVHDELMAVQVKRMRLGLKVLLGDGCERHVGHANWGDCFKWGKTADATYLIDRACVPCVVSKILDGKELPTGPGGHAVEKWVETTRQHRRLAEQREPVD